MAEEKEENSEKPRELRQEAERRLEGAIEDTLGVSLDEDVPLKELLHELKVHQVELEIQNEELRETRSRLHRSRKKYSDLYDFAPVSYLTLDEEGKILGANLTAADKFGTERDKLIGRKLYEYVAEEDKDLLFKHLRQLFQTKESQSHEIKINHEPSGSSSNQASSEPAVEFYGHLESTVFKDEKGDSLCRTALSDITTRRKAQRKIEKSEKRLRKSFVELAKTSSKALGVRDPYTQKHEKRVAEIAREIGTRMGLNEGKLFGLYLGGILHDVGKIAIPENILTKPGELKDVEWKMIKSHPKVGYDQILEDTDFPWPVAEMALHHHERLDGSGYPDGLEGDELILEVRILGAVDVVEAMSSRRPYREARSKERTLNVIKENRGEKFDPEVVDLLVETIEEGEIEFGG